MAEVAAPGSAEMAQSGDWEVRARAAADPNVSPEVVEKLARDSSLAVQRAVARSPRLTERAAETLRWRRDPTVRQNLAANPATPPRILEHLYHNGGVRVEVLGNPSVPQELLREVLTGRDWVWSGHYESLVALGSNPAVPDDLWIRLIEGYSVYDDHTLIHVLLQRSDLAAETAGVAALAWEYRWGGTQHSSAWAATEIPPEGLEELKGSLGELRRRSEMPDEEWDLAMSFLDEGMFWDDPVKLYRMVKSVYSAA